ncbi:hypothetical protein L6452_38197 [Arctium lappa]|uniref:Uncharacterized protein n=1 Tax=Arctium lappa TaxID=4217 RepID=A0ACB8Y5K0_ARCLA|nr:hypothetical protein L6452_38197 [Arctium lappa]
MYSQMEHFFNLDRDCYGPEWPSILTEVDRFCTRKYKDQKKKLKQHFRAVGGYEDVENAKKHPPTHISSENWNKTIDYFLEVDRRRKLMDLASKMTFDGSSSPSSSFEAQMIAEVLGERCGNDQDKSMEMPPGTYTTDNVKCIIDQFNEIVHQTNLNQQALLEAFTKGNPSATVPTIRELKPIVMPPPRQPPQQPPQHTNDSGDDESGSMGN